MFGIGVSVRGLYTPVLVMTALATVRLVVSVRPHVTADFAGWPRLTRFAAVAAAACAIPEFFHAVAADPREIRVLELPFGFRDGTLSVGNFTARTQFHQTLHHKSLIGGYVSRISRTEIAALRAARPTVDGLLTLSEGGRLSAGHEAELLARGPRFIERARVGYVVIDHTRASPALVSFAQRAFALETIAEAWPYTLYRPGTEQPRAPLP